ncbi:MAG: SDR family oxidoreductase [Proteobacteria bacterium]|nr:SDR family oxidoreductase [Pseudomonadota bacterium]
MNDPVPNDNRVCAAGPGRERVALVTGSTSGIGAAIARRLAADGFAVVVHSRASAEAGRAMAAELPGALYVQADLEDDAERTRLVAAAVGHRGRLDVLVNNAAISWRIPHADLAAATPEVWARMNNLNVIAPWRLITAAEGALRAAAEAAGRPASIVNISSHAGVRPKGASIPYAAGKAALNHMTKLLAAALAPAIRVNAVAPGLVDTPMTADWTDMRAMWRDRAPMRRPARPEDIADLVAMLIASDYVTGEIVLADGGLNLT